MYFGIWQLNVKGFVNFKCVPLLELAQNTKRDKDGLKHKCDRLVYCRKSGRKKYLSYRQLKSNLFQNLYGIVFEELIELVAKQD